MIKTAVAISDTHSWNSAISVPEADLLIHSGDLTNLGTKVEVEQAFAWISSLPHKHKVVIAGNHDFFLDTHWKAKTPQGQTRHGHRPKGTEAEIKELLSKFPSITYLNDSGVEIEGLKIFGSPIQPWFHDWSFNRERGAEILEHWKKIPQELDILITHGPPFGILDKTIRGQYTGCDDLLNEIVKRQIRLHVFGHIHEGRGMATRDAGENNPPKIFLNASSLDHNYEPFDKPYTLINIETWEILNGKK